MTKASLSFRTRSWRVGVQRLAALGIAAALLLVASALAASGTPKPGRYSGHVESVYQISFSVSSHGTKITALQTDFQAPCGVLSPKKVITTFPTAAIRNGRFRASKPHGVYTIRGHFSASGVASGTVTGAEKLTGFTKKPTLCKISAPFSAKRASK